LHPGLKTFHSKEIVLASWQDVWWPAKVIEVRGNELEIQFMDDDGCL
jgi:hypothetical protein